MIKVWLDKNKDVGIFLLRCFIGIRIIYGVMDNVLHWEHMMAFRDFLETFRFPFPLVSAIVSVYVQFIGGILLLAGYKVRLASFILMLNFLVALLMVHLKDTFEAMTPALALWFGCLVLFFYGGDRYSIERLLQKRNW